MNLKVATALTLSVAFAATLAAAPQATKSASAKTEQTKSAAPKAPAAEKVATADIPAPVKDAVMKAHPKAAISGATKTMKGTEAWYKVSFKDGDKAMSMTLDAMGKPAPPAKKK